MAVVSLIRRVAAAGLAAASLAAFVPPAAADDPPLAPVPGPMRPIASPAVAPEPAPIDRRRPPQAAALPSAPAPLSAGSVLEGVFRPGAKGEKAQGKAIARVMPAEVKLEKLAVTAGRDLELWLVATDTLVDGADLGASKHVSLGRLKKAEGDQTYKLPPEIDLRVYRMVVVWSRRERAARAGALLALTQAPRPVKAKSARAQ